VTIMMAHGYAIVTLRDSVREAAPSEKCEPPYDERLLGAAAESPVRLGAPTRTIGELFRDVGSDARCGRCARSIKRTSIRPRLDFLRAALSGTNEKRQPLARRSARASRSARGHAVVVFRDSAESRRACLEVGDEMGVFPLLRLLVINSKQVGRPGSTR
jgi:hypothetical protein